MREPTRKLPHCHEHPDVSREVDMQLHGELFRLGGPVDPAERRKVAERYGSTARVRAQDGTTSWTARYRSRAQSDIFRRVLAACPRNTVSVLMRV